MYKIVGVLAILLVCEGCTAVIASRFRVVDAVTGNPIQGVRAEGNDDMFRPSNFLGWPVYCHFRVGRVSSDETGLVQFDHGARNADFYKEGYEPCGVVSDWPGYRLRNRPLIFRAFSWEDERTAVIRLQPRKSE